MSGNDVMGAVAVVALIFLPFVAGWLTLFRDWRSRGGNDSGAGFWEEVDALARQRTHKREAMKALRRVARDADRPRRR